MKEYTFSYQELDSDSLLDKQDNLLLAKAREITAQAYAPYSHFFVGAAALLSNKEIVTATNQENASYPVGICAERVLLSAVSSIYNKETIETIAISYSKHNGKSDHPIAPCGMCRQALLEAQNRYKKPFRLILSGQQGKVLVIEDASLLLPLNFNAEELG